MAGQPFGPPDAAHANLDLNEQYASYVNIDGTLTDDRNSAIPRVVFGRKGSGKSHYLRALNAVKAADSSVLAFGTYVRPPDHDAVTRVALAFRGEAVPTWEALWHRAILASTAVTLLYDSAGSERSIAEMFAAPLEMAIRSALRIPDFPAGPMSPYGAARQILSHGGSREQLQRMLGSASWESLERSLEPIVGGSPPLYFFLDNLDAVEPFAPRPWQACQRGLLDAVLSLAEDDRWKRIHVVIALKDTIAHSLFDSFHGQKYVHSPSLHRLQWGTGACLEFFRRKIEALPEEWFTASGRNALIERWLARRSIENKVRRRTEDLEAYVLRHTLLLPRDVVEMGNCLCDAITSARERRRPVLDDDEVRGAVNRAALQIGKTGVYGAGVEMARRIMRADAALRGWDGAFGATEDELGEGQPDDMTFAISEAYAGVIKDAVRAIHHDRFGRAALHHVEEKISSQLHHKRAGAEAIGGLWRLGMLGTVSGEMETGDAVFYGYSEHDGVFLPDRPRSLAFHPSMIDYLGTIEAIGEPVYPEPGFLSVLGLDGSD